jgi:hypothetical protein
MVLATLGLHGAAVAAGFPATSIQQGQGFMSGMPEPSPIPGASVAAVRARKVEPSADFLKPRTLSHPGGLGLIITATDDPRVGSAGAGQVEVFQRESPGIEARRLVLRLTVPQGLDIDSASGDGWICRNVGRGAVCRGRDVTAQTAIGPVRVTLGADSRVEASVLVGRAQLMWMERRDATRVAAGLARPAPRGSRNAQLVRRTAKTSVKIDVASRLKIKAQVAGPERQPTGSEQTATIFRARIENIESGDVHTRWTQLCTTGESVRRDRVCGGKQVPAARFLDPTVNKEATADETIGVDLPDVDATTELWFRAEASDGGYTARDTFKVIAEPFREAVLDPRLDSLGKIDEMARPAAPEELTGSTQKLLKGSISGPSIATVKAGKSRTFTVSGSRKVLSTSWKVVRGDRRLLSGARYGSNSVTIRPGRRLALRSFALKGTARLEGGDRLEVAKVVKVLPAGRRGPRASMSTVGLRSARFQASLATYRRQVAAISSRVDARAAQITGEPVAGSAVVGSPERTLCAVAEVIKAQRLQPLPYPTGPIELDEYGRPLKPIGSENDLPDLVMGGDTQVWLGPDARLSSDRCDANTKITFTQAQIKVGENSFIDVDGQITTEGMQITAGSYRLPTEWATQIPGVRDALSKGLRFEVPKGTRVRALIEPQSGEWGALGGEIELPVGLELLPLPGGWKFKPMTLALETTGLVSLSIKAVAPSSGTEATGGSVLLEGRMDPLGQAEIEVTAANVATIRQANGDQVAFSGGGKLTFTQVSDQCQYDPATGELKDPNCDTNSDKTSLSVSPEVWVSAQGKVQLANNFALTKAQMLWSPERFEADMEAQAGSERSFVDFGVSGTYSSADDWRFAIRARSDNWEVVDGLIVERLEGQVTRSRGDPDQPAMTTIYAKAAARGWRPSPAFEVSSLDAQLTNECPKDGVVAKECKTGAVRLNLDVKGKAQLPIDGVGALDWESTASVDLSSLRFTLYGGVTVPDGGVGPEGLKLREIQINLSNEINVGGCVRRGAPVGPPSPQPMARLAADQKLNFSMVAKGTVMGKDTDFVGDFGDGLCLIGQMKGGMPADAPYSDSYGDVTVAYSSYDATYSRDGMQFSLDAKRVQLATAFKLPRTVEENLKLSGVGRFEATVGAARDPRTGEPTTGSSFDARISVNMTKGAEPILFGQAAGSHLRLDTAYLRLVWGSSTALTAATQMTYSTKVSGQDDGLRSSETPFSLMVAFDSSGATVSGGVDAQRSTDFNDKGEPVVVNAFGVPELKVYSLAISLTLGRNTSMGFRGDSVLPASWVRPIGIKAGARIELGASVSQTNPCFKFAISNEKAGEVAVDVANAGLLSANELNLLIAPTGCVIGDKTIDPGFGFKFTGNIGGRFPLEVEAQVQLPTPANPTRFYLYSKLQVPEFSLGTVAHFDKTDFELKLDPAKSDYLVRLNGGIDVLGQRVKIAADFQSTGGLGNMKLDGRTQTNLNVAGFKLDSDLAIKLDMQSFNVKTFGFNADMRLKVLGTTLAGAKADLLYDNGQIERFNLALTAGINVGVAAAEGTVRVNYNLLRENGAKTGPFKEREFKVGFGGKLRFLFWSTGFDWDIYSYRGSFTGTGKPGDIKDGATAAQDVNKKPALPWVKVLVYAGGGWGHITGVAYKTRYSVDASNAVDNKATSDRRGELVLDVCQLERETEMYRCKENSRQLTGVIDYPNKTIRVLDATYVQGSRWRFAYDLKGDDWTAMLKWIEAARSDFKAKNGRDLPPIRSWSALTPTAVGYVRYGDKLSIDADRKAGSKRLQWNASAGVGNTPRADSLGSFIWGRAFSFADKNGQTFAFNNPGRTTPFSGDFDGDGFDEIGQFIAPWMPDNTPMFRTKGERDIPATEVRRGRCLESSYCQPVEPIGTPFNPDNQAPMDGSRGAMYPVTGNWDISVTNAGQTVDDLGVVAMTGGTLYWELWPQGSDTIAFWVGGRQSNGVLDRPVTGDWNGDGLTDVGIYRPAAKVGEKSTWLLYDLAKINERVKRGDRNFKDSDADWTVERGDYGDMPVTGDWNNDGLTGVGVVSYADRALGNASPEWKLQDFVSTKCGTEACPPEHVFRYGTYDSYPIVGRWRP